MNSPVYLQRTTFTDEDKRAIRSYIEKPRAPNSFWGREAELAEYEAELCAHFGRKHCLLTNSGTSALHAAYFALGVGPGDEVIAPTYTHHATVMPLLQLGAVAVFADASPDTGNIDPSDVEARITPRTRAIVATHQWGHPVEGHRLRSIAERHRLVLLEDLSLAVGATLNGRLAGTFGHAACFSLGASKMFSGGQGGAVLFDDDVAYERANLLTHFGVRCHQMVKSPRRRQYADTGWGLNYRMHVLAVVVSRARFTRRNDLIAARHHRYTRLSEGLAAHPFLEPPITRRGAFRGQWQGYCVRYRAEAAPVSLNKFVEALRADGLELVCGAYQRPLHLTKAFQSRQNYLYHDKPLPRNWRSYREGDYPNAEAFYFNHIGFPLFLDEDLSVIDAYADACWTTIAE